MTKTSAQLESEIKAALSGDDGTTNVLPPWQQTSHPLVTRRAWLIKALLEDPKVGGKVTIGELTSAGGHSMTIEHLPSHFMERFGVSKYGITSAEVRYGSRHLGADSFARKMKIAINKAKKLT